MNGKKGLSAVLLIVMVLTLLGGCGRTFDASGYTKAVLDVSYKNETEEYIQLTGETKEEAEKIFTENMDVTMEAFQSMNFPEDLESQFRELFEVLAKNVKYTVGEAVEDKNGNFTVDVSIEPITIFNDTYEEFQKQAQEYATKVANDVMNGAEVPSDEDMQNNVYEIYYNILKSTVDQGIKYGEAEVVTVHVNKGDGNVYEILKEDMVTLDEKMISQDVL
ncbi:hypothetical protein [Faecalicatena contorta]|uniref:DUF5105 domain-containing protein n=1 Tax=Faecalicatena contorta TaxID=39482 RepID=A0A315ZNB4_9FIRM|nr:hypothetical protein [Faecalicatena contorta]PWJ47061.1 hypothetical protein A8805_1232 [Faecalicatena contorta]SUQ16162.1 hypothetical protein SAMN05216529_1232 [Faecalicatena contorta]